MPFFEGGNGVSNFKAMILSQVFSIQSRLEGCFWMGVQEG